MQTLTKENLSATPVRGKIVAIVGETHHYVLQQGPKGYRFTPLMLDSAPHYSGKSPEAAIKTAIENGEQPVLFDTYADFHKGCFR